MPVRSSVMETVDDVRDAARGARLPGRRGPRDRDLPRAAPAAAAAARGRGGRRQDRGGQGARPLDRRRAGAPPVLRGHRRRAGRLRVGLLPPAAAPPGGRGRRRRGRRGRALLRAVPREAAAAPGDRLRGRGARRTSRRRCCSSTRSTAPTTSSRRSCSRSSPTTRSPCPSSARSTPSVPPVVVVTSNRTRDVHDALKRRCLYHWIAHPDFERELAILRVRAPEVPEQLARQVAAAVESLRELELYKPPGVAETIDWAQRARGARAHRASTSTRSTSRSARSSSTARTRSAPARTASSELVRRGGGAECLTRAHDVEPSTSTGSRSASRACCAAPGSTYRSGARSPSPRRSARWAVGRVTRCTGRAGPRSCSRPEDVDALRPRVRAPGGSTSTAVALVADGAPAS